MSSARWPEHGVATLLDAASAPPASTGVDSSPAGLFTGPAQAGHPQHLVPCVACGALNGRSAPACWSCEADLIVLSLFVQPPPNRPAPAPIEPVPAAAGADGAAGRRGLHLVSRGEEPMSIEAISAPADLLDLPVLTAMVEENVPAPATQPSKARRLDRPMIALVLVALALLAAAAGLRWFTTGPVPVTAPLPAPIAPQPDEARRERPFKVPAPSAAPDSAGLSFPPADLAPQPAPALRPIRATPRGLSPPPPRAPNVAPRPAPKPREIRETISPPPAACTSNMAALGFCTLPPAPAKE